MSHLWHWWIRKIGNREKIVEKTSLRLMHNVKRTSIRKTSWQFVSMWKGVSKQHTTFEMEHCTKWIEAEADWMAIPWNWKLPLSNYDCNANFQICRNKNEWMLFCNGFTWISIFQTISTFLLGWGTHSLNRGRFRKIKLSDRIFWSLRVKRKCLA